MASNNKTPPAFKNGDDYDKWCKKIRIWQSFTNLDDTKQGPALFLVLEDDAQDAVLELDPAKIEAKDGVKNIISCLDELFKKDKTQSAFEALEAFEGYKRPRDLPMTDFCNEFERLYNKTKTYGTTVSEDVLAFRLLKAANLPSHQEQLAKATITELKLVTMKAQLKKIFGLGSESRSDGIKVEEELPELEEEEKTVAYGNFYRGRGDQNYRGNFRGRSYPSYGHPSRGYNNYRGSNNYRGNFSGQSRGGFSGQPRGGFSGQPRGRNPLNKITGTVTRCQECQSINHWVRDCPDRMKREKETYESEKYSDESETHYQETYESEKYSDDPEGFYHVTLFQSDYEEPRQLRGLTREAMNTAVLDCGAASTVCGDLWLKCYIDTLDEKDKDLIVYSASNNKFKFGDGNKVCSQHLVKFLSLIGQKEVFIETDVVNKDIPLLLSKTSMKNANTELNFRDDTVTMLDQKVDLNVTRSGHYTISIGRNKQIIDKLKRNEKVNITLLASKDMSYKDMAIKLHRQFGHRSAGTIIKLLKAAGKDDMELKNEIIKITKKCDICKVYKKVSPRPVVGLPIATVFNECVAMDLKKYGDVHLLHLIDHATRLSACSVIRTKSPSVIIREIFKIWISIY